MDKLAPIVLFVYNRLDHTKQTIAALQKNELASKSILFIYSDEAKNENFQSAVDEVRKYIDQVDGFKKVIIIKRKENWGLANSIIDGVTKIVNKYEKIIVLEDDLITDVFFLNYMNLALDKYYNNDNIFSITAFSFDKKFLKIPQDYNENIYFHKRPMSWSWAIWKNRWSSCDWEISNYRELHTDKKFIKRFSEVGPDLPNMLDMQMNKKIDSWYVRFCYSAYRNSQLTVYPCKSFVSNIGHDGTGVHCTDDNTLKYINILNETHENLTSVYFPKEIIINTKILTNFNQNFIPENIFIRIYKKLRSRLNI